VTYDRILPGILQSTDEIVINRVIFSVALTLLIYSVLFLFIIRRFFVRLTKALWDYLPGLAWKVLVALTIISSQFVILAAIYLVVYMLLVPRFF
jgi:hypothetical protein